VLYLLRAILMRQGHRRWVVHKVRLEAKTGRILRRRNNRDSWVRLLDCEKGGLDLL
jgi:hypothetical protein